MKRPVARISLAAAVLAVGLLVTHYLVTGPSGGDAGHAELKSLARTYGQALRGQSSLAERFVALLHGNSPSDYYRARYEEQLRQLTASGYLVEITVPVPDLRARLIPVINLLSNTSWQTGNYCRWTPDWRKDEVRLLCRQSDVALWERTLRDSSP